MKRFNRLCSHYLVLVLVLSRLAQRNVVVYLVRGGSSCFLRENMESSVLLERETCRSSKNVAIIWEYVTHCIGKEGFCGCHNTGVHYVSWSEVGYKKYKNIKSSSTSIFTLSAKQLSFLEQSTNLK